MHTTSPPSDVIDFDSNDTWFRQSASQPPFRLHKRINSKLGQSANFQSLVPFPWEKDSILRLWQGALCVPKFQHKWEQLICQYQDAIAIGSEHRVTIFFTQQECKPIQIKLPDKLKVKKLEADQIQLAWALINEPLEPWLIMSHLHITLIISVSKKQVVGALHGHGGNITHIAVHPTTPHLFCTASKDMTVRIYDLELKPQNVSYNPLWPPVKQPSQAGAAHGLHTAEPEGMGIGRCIGILVGGRSGGHQAAVLGAAFHHNLPIIATCGMDCTVKIWLFHPTSKYYLLREDKPIFSSSNIHKASVQSLTWLSDDILISHSAPILYSHKSSTLNSQPTSLKLDLHTKPAEVIIWCWLGLNRFFPSNFNQDEYGKLLYGCTSDYQESSCFKIIGIMHFPDLQIQHDVPQVHLYSHPNQDPLLIFTYSGWTHIQIINIASIWPQEYPEFPLDNPKVLKMIKHQKGKHKVLNEVKFPLQTQPSNWCIYLPYGESQTIHKCSMGIGGELVVGIGSQGSLWIWRKVNIAEEK